eukprot:Amastigsp_a175372_362.p2 type:complete len:344 gc:universal Amastigsp_a175372_362:1067-36(-)
MPWDRALNTPPKPEEVNPHRAIPPYSPGFFTICGIGGVVACSFTRSMLTPLDTMKVHMQSEPKKFPNLKTTAAVMSREGLSFWRGWTANAVGFGCQGFFRFGLYEVLKHKHVEAVGPELATQHRFKFYMLSAGIAEATADIVLCPFETVKLRLQARPEYVNENLRSGMAKLIREEGLGALWRNYAGLATRQVPYTVSKFASFEVLLNFTYDNLLRAPRAAYSPYEQLGVSFICGYGAGVICSIISHPQDTIVTTMTAAKKGSPEATMAGALRSLGFMGIWRGLSARLPMIGAIGAFQWLVYETVKMSVWRLANDAISAARPETSVLTVVDNDANDRDSSARPQ